MRTMRCCAAIALAFACLDGFAVVKRHYLPPGAGSAGFVKCVINERPVAADVAAKRSEKAKWYSGMWYSNADPADAFSAADDGALRMRQGCSICSAPPTWPETGVLPLLPGKDGFYVEFEYRVSDNDRDHFPAVWLLPAEKRRGHLPVVKGASVENFERYMELDVDEGGFGPGASTTVHNWWGVGTSIFSRPNPWQEAIKTNVLDRTAYHTFGASYDPKTSTVCWWLDRQLITVAHAPYVPSVAAEHNYYLIVDSWMHEKKKPYDLDLRAVRAFVPPESPLPAVPWDPEGDMGK